MLNLLIARHGNTFDKGDEILRVGLRTDLPLSSSGKTQAERLGAYLTKHYPKIDTVYCSDLIRTQETAQIALQQYHSPLTIERLSLLNEIDYGEDDGQPETTVIKRLGQQAIDDWETNAILPTGWLFDKPKRIQEITQFAEALTQNESIKTVLLITSNGIARFFRTLLNETNPITSSVSLKLGTGCLSSLRYDNGLWSCDYWNLRPSQSS